jgi:hypothetical protein
MNFETLDSTTEAAKGAFLHLLHPETGEELWADKEEKMAVGVDVLGADSKTYRKILHRLQNRRTDRLRKKKDKNKFLRAEDVEIENIEATAGAVLKFHHIEMYFDDDGEIGVPPAADLVERACVAADAPVVLARFPWMYEQIEAFLNDRANYMGK